VNSAAMTIGEQVSMNKSLPSVLGVLPCGEFPLFSFFEETQKCCPQQLSRFTFPPVMYEVSDFTISLPTLVMF
jgi:hypothetical protein